MNLIDRLDKNIGQLYYNIGKSYLKKPDASVMKLTQTYHYTAGLLFGARASLTHQPMPAMISLMEFYMGYSTPNRPRMTEEVRDAGLGALGFPPGVTKIWSMLTTGFSVHSLILAGYHGVNAFHTGNGEDVQKSLISLLDAACWFTLSAGWYTGRFDFDEPPHKL